MLRRIFATLAVFAVALTMLPASAEAASQTYRYRGDNAYAYFSQSSDCIVNYVYIHGGDYVYRGDIGAPEANSSAMVWISRYNTCEQRTLLSAHGDVSDLADEAFMADQPLQSASLEATIDVYDYVSGDSFPVTVDVSWTGSGELVRGNSHYHYQSETFIINGQYNGTFRPAAISGAISAESINFTAEMTGSGEITSVKSGSVQID